ncbi:MAG: flagellar hook-associated protein FlgK [Thiotrichales bacterium]|nr:flagellar hook-associated protein FlgK [Thiotrichales bacterium]
MGILNTSVTGLLTAQRALSTTGHNIANVNTPGYSRQEVIVSSRPPQFTGAGFFGKGVEISNVVRIHSEFLTEQLRTSTSSQAENEIFFQLANRIDNILADEQTGLSPTLLNFFNAVQDVADLPSSTTARQALLSEAETLAARFHFIDAQISGLVSEIRTTIRQNITEINSLASAVADMNKRIADNSGENKQIIPNDLLDQRDELIRKISEFISISTVQQADGVVNVFTGNGQPVVLGTEPSTFSVSEPYLGHFEITRTDAFTTVNLTGDVRGGTLGGLLRFQDEMLSPSRNSLGRIGIGLADTFNDMHRLGMSLDGDVDQPFFNVAQADVLPVGGAPANVSADIVDPTNLSNSDYSLVYNGGNLYTLIRLSDNQTTNIDTLGASPFTTTTIDGFTLTITAGATAGDEFIIRPTINGARDFATLITDPRKVAAAGPLRSGEVVDGNGLPTNTGTGDITQVDITSTTGILLGTPITLTFNSATNQFNISAPPGGTLAYNPATESGGKQFTIAAAGNATFTISGVPADGDQFVIENNTNANGDNRNALKLAGLQSQPLLIGATATYQDAYGQMVAEGGTRARQAEITSLAVGALLEQSIEAREALSGVNLDEEAANMLKFQQAYQAAAQMIATADRLFQQLINAFN